MPPILELHGISKSFPGVQALSGVDFSLELGEVHALLGENGAGKSTLIKIISGVYQADQGQMLIDGQPYAFHNPREAQRAGVATIFQELILYPELTVAENIFMGHAPRSRYGLIDWRAMRQRAQELLASLEIYDMDVDSKVGAMSVGKRQRVEIAKALSHNARILIMDEPTAALTEADVERLFNIVRLLKQRGVSIIYISHRLEEIFMLADRVTVLRDGQHVATKAVRDTHESDLIQMMVGREIDDLFPKLPSQLGATVLRVRGVARHPLPRGVSLEVRAGEIVGLAGLVGSGRTELAHVLFGITTAQEGEIWLDGQRVQIKNPSQAMRLGIAYVPEDRGNQGLIKQMKVRENTSLAILRSIARSGFINHQAERDLADRFVRELSIRTPSIEQVVNKLSGGNQQKIVVSKWLASKPKLLIMDEPTRGVDVGAKSEIHRLISQLASEGMAILMISSELPEILGMSDRVLVMREGRIVAEFSRAEATQERVGAAMMGEVYRQPIPEKA
ncbi:MAG: sugar ABC transporter ATP-binding protein [Anaerolineae bacterium]|nr:sugar ABC transporter ATP-binding protein [Anaerolineae bacterium]MDW8173163.1 sugar ABC transporter ATP-binding protein [Anaerolineae bacterium]